MVKLIKLKRLSNNKQVITAVAVGLSHNQTLEVKHITMFNKSREEQIKDIIRQNYDEPISDITFFFIGELTGYPQSEYKHFIRKVAERGHGGKPAYRNYAVSLEQQKKAMWSVNVCEDLQTSWNTVRTTLGARNIRVECYGAIAQITYNK